MAEKSTSSETTDDNSSGSRLAIDIKTREKTQEIDPELDELLDSVLEDLNEGPAKENVKGAKCDSQPDVKKTKSAATNSVQKTEAVIEPKDESTKKYGPSIPPAQEALFNELFGSSEVASEATKEFQNAMQDFMKDIEEMGGNHSPPDFANFFGAPTAQPPAAGASQPKSDGTTPLPNNPADLNQTLGETFQRLSQTAQELQGDEHMFRSMGDLNLGGGGPGGPDNIFLPMMQEMMQGLLSKDVLYPSLKEIIDKYPEWLENNESSLEKSEFERYKKQQKMMGQLCDLYESEKSSDRQEVKQQRLLQIIELVQQMESLGQPPKELAGDMPFGFDLDENGLPKFPGMPSGEQCAIM
ncbi:peroxisomal biogenesis factor 19-like [Antedon mediterranea]|uniref:peroxisomal biogenesis factor 19-like n=1 Tax=Antedon mediterranea TaxID=105859 RepID=UPI003AF5A663